ncbi:squalene--hopene cyclase [Halobacillus litoralis]|uniref:Squalene--hopene cyclase n=1 Tax=Halobacillus litoralis TaxID=45668 RepID=A0A845DXL7_9BACI|nr:squalene--hopene cyclase [Halobacillus litoralis]
MKEQIHEAIAQLAAEIHAHQTVDGSFHFCFENSLMTDANMILLLQTFTKEKDLIQQLCARLSSLQTEEGYWKLYADDAGNLSATIEAVFALLYAGYYSNEDLPVKKAKAFIRRHGGLNRAHSLTKMTLAIHGEYPWPNLFHLPVHIILLPPSSPISFYDFSSYARVHMAPILLLSDQPFVMKNKQIPDMSDCFIREDQELISKESRSLLTSVQDAVKSLAGLPHKLYLLSRQRLLTYMLQRIESDGTLYSYFTSTFYMIYALVSCGYQKHDPIIKKAIQGLIQHACSTDRGLHIQNSPSDIWDTALLSHALQAPPTSDVPLHEAEQFLLKHQQTKFGDWMVATSHTEPGGWGFSKSNTIHPDVDDTTAALRALRKDSSLQSHYTRGLKWVLAMQNEDGGWPAFEKGKTNPLMTFVPMDGAEYASLDPSTADLTGRTLEFLGTDARFPLTDPRVQRALNWLRSHQENDGSWYGRWGITYIYGTWAALTGMRAVGVSKDDRSIKKGIHFLESIQNEDGGWGESCKSDQEKSYIPLGDSTLSQTSWALAALMAVHERRTPSIERGISCLLRKLEAKDWTYEYPTGAGLPGHLYIYYHSYNYIWPLLVLKKYLSLSS